jgi:hypothetical protein
MEKSVVTAVFIDRNCEFAAVNWLIVIRQKRKGERGNMKQLNFIA